MTTKAKKTTRWTIEVPDYLPPSLNELVGTGVRRRHRKKSECGDFLAVYSAGVPRVQPGYAPRRRVKIVLHGWPRGPVADPDNMLKALLDGLKQARLIVDDSQEWCDWQKPELVRSDKKRTIVTLEDVTDGT